MEDKKKAQVFVENQDADQAPVWTFADQLANCIKGMKAGDAASKYEATGMVLDRCGDHEMADLMRRMACQMEFDDNAESVPAIERTKKQIQEAIRLRKMRHYRAYLDKITDEEILIASNGEVTQGSMSSLGTRFLEGGLYDPAIFGGSGKMPTFDKDTDHYPDHDWGFGMGHIILPVRIINERDLHTAADIIGIPISGNLSEVVGHLRGVVCHSCYIVTASEDDDYKIGDFVPLSELASVKKDHPNVTLGTGADTLYEMMKAKNYPDHPERIAYQVIPVVSPYLRPYAFSNEDGCGVMAQLNGIYERILSALGALKRLMKLGAPEIIIANYTRRLFEVVSQLYKEFGNGESLLKLAGKKNLCRVLRDQAYMAYRGRSLIYEKVAIDVTHPIEDCGYYPETIILRADGEDKAVSFEEIYLHNLDLVGDWVSDNSIILPSEDESEWDEETKKEVEEYDKTYSRLTAMEDDLLKASHEKGSSLVVTEDGEFGMYVMVS